MKRTTWLGGLTAAVTTVGVLLCMTIPAAADVVELKNGQRVEGAFKSADEVSVRIEVGGQTVTFKPEQVRAIYYGAAPATSSAPSLGTEALRALKALQSAVGGGLTYRDYGPRLTDTKIQLDRYFDSPIKDDKPVRAAMDKALQFHLLALTAWSAKISKADAAGMMTVGTSPLVDECAGTREIAQKSKSVRSGVSQEIAIGLSVSFEGIPALWSCAAEKVAEAENLLAGVRR